MDKQIAKTDQTAAEIFMSKVITEFTTGDSPIALTQFQRRLAKNYFITLNAVLARAETGRLKKTEKWRDKVPVTWDHVNMQKLAQDVVAVCRIGLDPAQKNHISMIPYKNNTTKLYDIGMIEGYRGLELKSVKYGLDVPDAVIVELVYSDDKFKSYKKDKNHLSETYEFEIVNDFDRGDIIGGFYFHFYKDHPEKNRLAVMTLEEIEKRKPRYAAPEFWGGEKPKWENGQKVGTESVEGWHKEMCWKTIYRAAYNDITIDSQKIDSDYMRMKEIEGSVDEHAIQEEIDREANKEFVDIESGEIVDAESESGQEKTQQKQPDIDALFHKQFLWHKGKATVEKINKGFILIAEEDGITEERIKREALEDPEHFLQEVDRIVAAELSPEPSEKSKSKTSTEPPVEGGEVPETQEGQTDDKTGFPPDNEFSESPVDTALRTAKEEKEKLQNPESKPSQVADLKSYLDQCEDKNAGLKQIEKDYFKALCQEDRAEIKIYHKKLTKPQTQGPVF